MSHTWRRPNRTLPQPRLGPTLATGESRDQSNDPGRTENAQDENQNLHPAQRSPVRTDDAIAPEHLEDPVIDPHMDAVVLAHS